MAPKNSPPQKRSKSTSSDAAYEKLRADILRGALRPAARLRVIDVAERYRYGAIPTREALNRLTAERLVIYSEQRGFAVAPISRGDLIDLAKARSMMVEVAMRQAVLKGDGAWEERVLVAYHRLSKVPCYLPVEPRLPNPDYDFPHRLFHSALISGCGSQWMVMMCERLFDHAERYRYVSHKIPAAPRDDQHKKMVAAALGRRLEEAVALSKRHVEATAEVILAAPPESSPMLMD